MLAIGASSSHAVVANAMTIIKTMIKHTANHRAFALRLFSIRKMTLLCAAKVRSRICVCGKGQLEVAEWYLVSPRQVRNCICKDTKRH